MLRHGSEKGFAHAGGDLITYLCAPPGEPPRGMLPSVSLSLRREHRKLGEQIVEIGSACSNELASNGRIPSRLRVNALLFGSTPLASSVCHYTCCCIEQPTSHDTGDAAHHLATTSAAGLLASA